MDKLCIYIMHSEKMDYVNILYKPLIKNNLLKEFYLYLPLSEKYNGTYIKDLLNKSDIVICDLTNFNIFSKIELKYAIKMNKIIFYYINKNDKNKKKYIKYNYKEYDNSEDLIISIKSLLSSLDKKSLFLKRENVYCLGKISK